MAVRTEFAAAIRQVCSERGIEPSVVFDSLKFALVAAYRKDIGVLDEEVEIEVKLDEETGDARIMREGKDVTPEGFGRIAAQTAKQVILQRVREAEKEAIISEYRERIGSVVNGMVQRFEGPNVIVDVGRSVGLMPPHEQVEQERYRLNQRMKVLIKEIKDGPRGEEIIVSRSDKLLVSRLFETEVPEIGSGSVEVKAVAREPGSRSKIAVTSHQDGVDPIGSCVGQRGVRVRTVTAELNDEKIDIILWSPETARFIVASLSPAKVTGIKIFEDRQEAVVTVAEDQLSLAIGKEGQNVRLAAKLTGWHIDIKGADGAVKTSGRTSPSSAAVALDNPLVKAGLSTRVANILMKANVESVEKLKTLSPKNLKEIPGLGPKAIAEIEAVKSA